ncbi:MAG: DUF1499 domain-containing protein, partial [Gemmatimonadaceae bacterium]
MPPRRPLPIIAVIGPALAILAALALALAGPGTRAGWWDFRTGFTFLRYAAYGGIAAVSFSLLGALATRPGSGRRGFLLSLLGMALGAAAIAVPWSFRRGGMAAPPIHDITTDTRNPPRFVAVLPLRADAANPAEYGGDSVAAQQRSAYPDIVPLALTVPPARAYSAALATARASGWEIVAADSAEGRVEATDRTRWFGFRDDVVVRVAADGAGSRVDVRSVSRV